eukprot:1157853-Pelagomonas_calceolata.AAC.3
MSTHMHAHEPMSKRTHAHTDEQVSLVASFCPAPYLQHTHLRVARKKASSCILPSSNNAAT